MSLTTIGAVSPLAAFAIGRTLPLEGGLVNNAADPGGITNLGVSLRFALGEVGADPDLLAMFDIDHDGDVDAADIRGMTVDQAADIYFDVIWKPGFYARCGAAMLSWKTFDIAVNAGPKRSGYVLQTALSFLGYSLAQDGNVGTVTLGLVAQEVAADSGLRLLGEVRQCQADFYRNLVARKPAMGQFLGGWLHRAAA